MDRGLQQRQEGRSLTAAGSAQTGRSRPLGSERLLASGSQTPTQSPPADSGVTDPPSRPHLPQGGHGQGSPQARFPSRLPGTPAIAPSGRACRECPQAHSTAPSTHRCPGPASAHTRLPCLRSPRDTRTRSSRACCSSSRSGARTPSRAPRTHLRLRETRPHTHHHHWAPRSGLAAAPQARRSGRAPESGAPGSVDESEGAGPVVVKGEAPRQLTLRGQPWTRQPAFSQAGSRRAPAGPWPWRPDVQPRGLWGWEVGGGGRPAHGLQQSPGRGEHPHHAHPGAVGQTAGPPPAASAPHAGVTESHPHRPLTARPPRHGPSWSGTDARG